MRKLSVMLLSMGCAVQLDTESESEPAALAAPLVAGGCKCPLRAGEMSHGCSLNFRWGTPLPDAGPVVVCTMHSACIATDATGQNGVTRSCVYEFADGGRVGAPTSLDLE